MRTNIEIDDALMAEAFESNGGGTKREIVEKGLRALIRANRQLKVLESRGKYRWEGDLEAMRLDD